MYINKEYFENLMSYNIYIHLSFILLIKRSGLRVFVGYNYKIT